MRWMLFFFVGFLTWDAIFAWKNCRWSWTRCSKTCGLGIQKAYVTKKKGIFGKCKLPGPRLCNTGCCPRNGEWYTPFPQSWSPCSASCKQVGIRRKTRECRGPYCGGKPCSGTPYEIQRCHGPCNCAWAEWESWTTCSLSCDGGTQYRSRVVEVEMRYDGEFCKGDPHESRLCNTGCCPEHCVWVTWLPWSSCSVSCGLGSHNRKRGKHIVESCGGKSCIGKSSETRYCNAGCCPADCKWGDWDTWSKCSRSCGAGSRRRHRSMLALSDCGGAPCIGESHERQTCNEHCCATDCKWGEWGQWSNCSKSCDLGLLTKTRIVSVEPSCGGTNCEGSDSDSEYCNAFCCPNHCDWDEWSEWTECSRTCETGQQSRTRSVTINPDCAVKRCVEPHHQEKNCTMGCCPIDCEFASWTEWSDCSTSCGTSGLMNRHRNITKNAECGGTECRDIMRQTMTCNRFCFHNATLSDNECICPDEWEGVCCEIDIDECAFTACLENSVCFNTYGSYECVCNNGFVREDGLCLAVSACYTGDHQCHENAQCISTRTDHECKCKPGFQGNGTFCSDIDECTLELKEMERILEDVGSGEEDLSVLAEAGDGLSPLCHGDASCRNAIGSFACSCNPGFTGNGSVCEDVDECLLQETVDDDQFGQELPIEVCHEHATCSNVPGSYYCTCEEGYNGNGTSCKKLNACDWASCKNDGECVDLNNSYECKCTTGYTGKLCEEDIDECISGNNACISENEICVNAVGSYECSCKKSLTRVNEICQDLEKLQE